MIMKSNPSGPLFLIVACLISHASAATMMTITAGGGVPSAEGWAVTTTSGDPNRNGEFSGDSGTNGGGSGAGAGDPAWALYANNAQTADATYTLAGGALNIGQALGIDFDHGIIGEPSNPFGSVGVVFSSGGVEALAVTISAGAPAYVLTDSGGSFSTGFPSTFDGLNINVAITASGEYDLNLGGASFAGTLANSTSSIDTIRVFNFSAGGGGDRNVFFNNLTVVPEPSSALLGSIALLGLLRRRR